jgi:hypothetical protein
MKTVRLKNNIVVEIIPEYALPVEKWYGVEFANQCLKAPNTTEQGFVYDPETKKFSAPVEATATPTEQRENAYNTDPVIEWGGDMLTVTQAATLWQYYAAEGSEKANELQTLIATAKQTIREQFPDKEVE